MISHYQSNRCIMNILTVIIVFTLNIECLCFWWNTQDDRDDFSRRVLRRTHCRLYGLTIINCDITISRFGNEKLEATFNKTCDIKEKKFTFYFGREGGYLINFDTENPFITVDDMKKKLQKTNFEIGSHFIWVKMQAFTMKSEPLTTSSEQCHFYVRPENATATLGRLNRNVQKAVAITVDASKSKNNDIGKHNVGLYYKWNCSDTVGFCDGKDLGTDSRVHVPKKYVTEGAHFSFTVEVRTDQTPWQKALQLINVNSSMPYVINCVKNCGKEPNTWNPRVVPWIFSECQFYCNKYRRADVKGKLLDESGNVLIVYQSITSQPNAVEQRFRTPGKRYRVRSYHEKKGIETIVGETDFYTYPLPKLENCQSVPPVGGPMTKFKISCDYEKETTRMFYLHIKTNNTDVYAANASTLEEIEFLVSSASDVFVTIEDVNEVTNKQNVSVKVDPLIGSEDGFSNTSDILKNLFNRTDGSNSVNSLIQQGDYKSALQIMGMLASALSEIKTTDDEDKGDMQMLKKELLTDLSDIPINDMDTAKSMSGIISTLAKINPDELTDVDMTKMFTTLCRDLAKKQLHLAENDDTKTIKEKELATIAKNLLSCAETDTMPDYDIFNETEMYPDISTKYPIRNELTEKKTFEDYPQYIAEDIIEDKVKNFIDAADNVLDICRDMGNSMIATFDGHMIKPSYINGMKSTIGLIKCSGARLSNIVFQQHNVTIVPSQIFRGMKSTLTMRVCSYKYNPFWAASVDFRIPTSLIDVSITKLAEKTEITDFGTYPMNISFELLENSKVRRKITYATLTIPDRTSEYREDNFTIFIIETRKGESFFIEFYNLTDSDSIDVVVVFMVRPALRLFANSRSFNANKNKTFIEVSEKEEDSWYLVAMRPNKTKQTNQTTNVSFSVYTPRCVRWDPNMQKWTFACSVYVKSTHQTIHCRCSHLSTLAATIEYNTLKEHSKFLRIDFFLEEEGSLYIISVVTVFLFLYSFLLVYSVEKNETLEDAVFFMSDVPAHCRYAYLVQVKTGARINSGTTSDIAFEVIGINGISLKHVLNFPDPFCELLQRSGVDYLVFASDFYLGPLKRINLWFDCSGTSPAWFCHSVKICDLQTKRWYIFDVKKWLRIDDTPRIFMSIPVSDQNFPQVEDTKERFFSSLLKFGHLERTIWQLFKRSNEPNFGPTKRFTMMLSVILTVMSLTMRFHVNPELLPRDFITKHCYYHFRWQNILVGLYSSVITFFPHLALITGFKTSSLHSQTRNSKNVGISFHLTYILWVVLIINILLHVHNLVIYGPWVTHPTTGDWTTSCIIAMIVYIFFIEFMYGLFLDMVMRTKISTRINFNKILTNVEVQRKHLYKLFGNYVYRPILEPIYNFMDGAEYKAKVRRIYFRQKEEVASQIQDLLMTIALIIFFSLIVLGEKDEVYDIRGHEEVLKLIYGPKNKRVSLDIVNHISDFHVYMEETFIPTIQSYQWYGRYLSNNPGMTSDACNKYLGVVRLRQHRVEAHSCAVVEPMKFLNTTCYSSVYFFQYDFRNYTPQWNRTINGFHSSRLGYVWGFQKDSGGLYFAENAYYPLGGYIAFLGRTIKNSLINLNYLKRQNWLDHRTRALMLEFCLYNVNANLFHFAGIFLERTPSGYIYSKVSVKTERILNYGAKANTISLICGIFFMIFVLILSVRTGRRLILSKIWHNADLWLLIDIGIVAFSIAWLVMHFKKLTLLQEFAKELEEKPNDAFIDYFEMLGLVNTLSFLTSFLVCFTIIRIWKLLRFAVVFRTVERTLIYSFETLLVMSLALAIFFIGFGFMSYVFLGAKLKEFQDWYYILKVMILLLSQTQKEAPGNMGVNERGLGYAYFVFYAVFCLITRTMFVAIIVFNYKKARRFAFEERIQYNMKDYTHEKYHQLKRLGAMWIDKFRLKAGGVEKQEYVTPKANCSRYMNFLETDSNRMKAMASVAKCVLTKKLKGQRIDRSDHILMMETIQKLNEKGKGEKEIFFMGGNKLSGFTFVDDRRILMMEKIVKSLLESPQERARRRKRTDLIEALKADNAARMMQMNYRLKLMLKAVENIEIKIEPKNS